ncbi:hypothetical protein ACUIJQ_07115 [Levilactobacillus hammesii]|uniref:Uncharacterized protein n=1 Tax=Levilactobacillus hammesii DSM 16381 TaxID=1423753 RepID=A0A0R1UP02_9LACO|nr:hypothetical protein [Levilactobacillus hammesii]KRL93123.1 hypothetical protein FD28_GL001571 [Levilactobacillus hammesii DSM 16381]
MSKELILWGWFFFFDLMTMVGQNADGLVNNRRNWGLWQPEVVFNGSTWLLSSGARNGVYKPSISGKLISGRAGG